MNSAQEQIIQETFMASNAGQAHFGDVVSQLTAAGVESYTVDYRSHQTIYHLRDDATLILDMPPSEPGIADVFSATDVRAAIRGAQQGTVMYPEFKQLSMKAGCIGYTVWIAGRHVTYFGRKGETHVEQFPAARHGD